MYNSWRYIFSLILAAIMISSCSSHFSLDNAANSEESKIQIYQFEYQGFEYPDSLKEAVSSIERFINVLPKDPKQQYIISDFAVAHLFYDTLDVLIERTVYDLHSYKVIRFDYKNNQKFYTDLTDAQHNNNFGRKYGKPDGPQLTKVVPEEYKIISEVKCYKYVFSGLQGALDIELYINEDVPIEYFKGINNAPKGIPFYSSVGIMMGVNIIRSVSTDAVEVDNSADLLIQSKKGYKDMFSHNKNQLLNSNWLSDVPKYKNRQSSYLSIRNDTIVLVTPRSMELNDFQLSANPEQLKFSYIITRSQDTTITVSTGPIYDIDPISTSLSFGRYNDEYRDVYSIYLEQEPARASFAQIWKARRNSAYLWESFSTKQLSNDSVKRLLQDIAKNLLGIEDAKVFIAEDEVFTKTPWMMSISNYAFSRQ